MPRVRILCQGCGRKLSYLELAPFWRARAVCPACGTITIATVSPTGQVELRREEVARQAPTAAQAARPLSTDGRKAG